MVSSTLTWANDKPTATALLQASSVIDVIPKVAAQIEIINAAEASVLPDHLYIYHALSWYDMQHAAGQTPIVISPQIVQWDAALIAVSVSAL